ncbi:hypothetical protein M885DRAFT_550731 [Pelagophyceae sp. CCMP2097]|nr:hypothetical protein M885DRAFT_550731 [Pelagophyceae sp. CCMP2097]
MRLLLVTTFAAAAAGFAWPPAPLAARRTGVARAAPDEAALDVSDGAKSPLDVADDELQRAVAWLEAGELDALALALVKAKALYGAVDDAERRAERLGLVGKLEAARAATLQLQDAARAAAQAAAQRARAARSPAAAAYAVETAGDASMRAAVAALGERRYADARDDILVATDAFTRDGILRERSVSVGNLYATILAEEERDIAATKRRRSESALAQYEAERKGRAIVAENRIAESIRLGTWNTGAEDDGAPGGGDDPAGDP